MKVLVTGANGFVGRALCRRLLDHGLSVRGAIRSFASELKLPREVEPYQIGSISESTEWSGAMENVDVVVHLAARVHVMQDSSSDPLAAFRMVNVHGSERLARMAVSCGVRRLVYMSSIGVHGKSTSGRPFVEDDDTHPHSPYSISKWEGELALRKIETESDLELVIIRPPLVYGAGVGGNFLRLMQWAQRGLPLPLKSIRNRRSFIGIENLCDLIICCVLHPDAAGETFLAADGEDLSTPDLIDRVSRLMGRSARLVPLPVGIIRVLGELVGKSEIVDRLCNSLQVDARKARTVLKWQPRISLDEGFKRTVKWYMDQCGNGESCVF